MSVMAEVHTVRVFTDAQGLFGNNLGVVLDAAHLDAAAGSKLAADLRFSEVVFVDDVDRAALRIFTPAAELPLAGHPLVGTAWHDALPLLLAIGAGVLAAPIAFYLAVPRD